MKRFFLLLVLVPSVMFGQLNPMNSIYYFNRYEANPSLAGATRQLELNLGIKAQWTKIQGAPMMQGFTAIKGFDNHMGIGLMAKHETTGLLERTQLKGSYAYHIPLDYDGGNSLDLGLSVGLQWERVDINRAVGDMDDATLYAYNRRPMNFDGDFGAALRYNGWNAQLVLPNLRDYVRHQNSTDIADRFSGMAALSYRFFTSYSETATLEPLAMFRMVQGFRSIFDLGLQGVFEDGRLHANAIYHSSHNLTVGVGTQYNGTLGISVNYSSDTGAMKTISNGEFGIAIKYKMPVKQQ